MLSVSMIICTLGGRSSYRTANSWPIHSRTVFPYNIIGANGWKGTSPVGAFPKTRHRLLDMIGNVWEWITSTFTDSMHTTASCCSGTTATDAITGQAHRRQRCSYLCSPSYCVRYRPAARQPQSPDSATTHLGFRYAS